MSKPVIVRMKQDEINALFEFRHRVLPENDKRMDRERWRWLLGEGSKSSDGEMTTWLMKAEGRIVGCISGIPVFLNVGGRRVRALFGADYFVEETYKGLPALMLLKKMHKDAAVHIGMNLSESAGKLFAKLGYTDLSEDFVVASMVLVCPHHGLKGRIRSRLYRCRRRMLCSSDYVVETGTGLHIDYGHLWDRVRESYAIRIEKNTDYMSWRYANCPSRKYHFVWLKKAGELLGVAVIAKHVAGKEIRGIIHDIIVPNGDRSILRNLLCRTIDYFEKEDCHSCELQIMAPWALDILKLLGFCVGRSSLGMMVLVVDPKGHFSAMQNSANWILCLGDTDRY
jgi:hypothetical protein